MALSSYHDASYTTFLKLLHTKSDILHTPGIDGDPAKLGGTIAHYLAHLPTQHVPSFCNALSTSPAIWLSEEGRDARGAVVREAFRGGVRLREASLLETHENKKRKVGRALREWADAVVKGVVAQRPDPAIRLAILTGLVQGMGDVPEYEWDAVRGRVEAEIVVACAELVEVVIPEELPGAEDWGRQYEEGKRDRLPLASQHLSLMLKLAPAMLLLSMDNLVLLDLEIIARLALDQISYIFQGGHFLKSLPSSLSTTPDGLYEIEQSSFILTNLTSISSNPGFQTLSTLSKLLARCLAGLVEQSSTKVAGWELMVAVIERMEDIARPLEADFARSPWAGVVDESRIAPQTKPHLTTLWTLLKSLLFTNILLTQSMLLSIAFHPHPPELKLQPQTHPHAIAGAITSLFLHLSFITSRFGGGLTSTGGGFPEQKRAFYGALDVLGADKWETELCLKRVGGKLAGLSLQIGHPVREARTSFFLACAEQLMPKLSESLVEHAVLPVAYQHLSQPGHRETYESAHSVVLSIFSNHAKLHTNEETSKIKHENKEEASNDEKGKLAARLVPFYSGCVLENSEEGKLSIDQLCLAYSSLTRSATSTSTVLAQLCIDNLLAALSASSSAAHITRLRLVLISLISTVDSALLPSLLETVRAEVLKERDYEKRLSLKDRVFKEVLKGVGDAEREIAMKWWLDVESELEAGV